MMNDKTCTDVVNGACVPCGCTRACFTCLQRGLQRSTCPFCNGHAKALELFL
jgi:hypothetical protein